MVSQQMLRSCQSLEWSTTCVTIPVAKALGQSQKIGYDDLEDYDNCALLYNYFNTSHPRMVTRTLLVDNRNCKPFMQELAIQHVNIARFHKNIYKLELRKKLMEQRSAIKKMDTNALHKLQYFVESNRKYFSLDSNNYPKDQYFMVNELDFAQFRSMIHRRNAKYFCFMYTLEELKGTAIPSNSNIGPEIFEYRCPCVSAKDALFEKLMGEKNIVVSY